MKSKLFGNSSEACGLFFNKLKDTTVNMRQDIEKTRAPDMCTLPIVLIEDLNKFSGNRSAISLEIKVYMNMAKEMCTLLSEIENKPLDLAKNQKWRESLISLKIKYDTIIKLFDTIIDPKDKKEDIDLIKYRLSVINKFVNKPLGELLLAPPQKLF